MICVLKFEIRDICIKFANPHALFSSLKARWRSALQGIYSMSVAQLRSTKDERIKRMASLQDQHEVEETSSNMIPIPREITLSTSPVFSTIDLDNLRNKENTGVPLNSQWTFYLDRAIRGTTAAEYQESLKRIYSVSTVQGFWAVLNHIPIVGELAERCSYHLMRGDRLPLWEDPANTSGGTWRLKCSKKDSEQAWRELLLAAIGEQLSEHVASGDEICGVTVSARRDDDLLQVWNVNAKLAPKATMLPAIHKLLPDVQFTAEFYKSNQAHDAFEGRKTSRSSR